MKCTSDYCCLSNDRGISLIEVIMIIVIVAIVMAVAMQSMAPGMENARQRKTEHEMEMIIHAIAGDPSIMSVAGGMRSDFGYVGDVGSFPPTINALLENPGGYSTWDGPYIAPQFIAGFDTDEWGQAYSYSGGLDVTSNGSGTTINKHAGNESPDILLNTVNGIVKDMNDSAPGTVYCDSVDIEIIIPDGAGSIATKSYRPDSTGLFTLDSIPIGRHHVVAIYKPEVDTLARQVTVLPRHNEDGYIRFNFAEDYFSEETGGGGGDTMLTLVENSQQFLGSGSNCNNISFDISNNTGADVDLTSVTLTWSSPTAYYQAVWWESTMVWSFSSQRNGSGEVATFSSAQTITDGSTVTIEVHDFKSSSSPSSGTTRSMSDVTFTVLFSDGSTFDVTMPSCP